MDLPLYINGVQCLAQLDRNLHGLEEAQAESGDQSGVRLGDHPFVIGYGECRSRRIEHGVVGSRRVAAGDCSPAAPTDPDVPNSGIRLLGLDIRYVA